MELEPLKGSVGKDKFSTTRVIGAHDLDVVATLSIVRAPGHVIQHENGQQNVGLKIYAKRMYYRVTYLKL